MNRTSSRRAGGDGELAWKGAPSSERLPPPSSPEVRGLRPSGVEPAGLQPSDRVDDDPGTGRLPVYQAERAEEAEEREEKEEEEAWEDSDREGGGAAEGRGR